MKIEKLLKVSENEKPLDNILLDGGYTSIFRHIAIIGDSLSSGEFEAIFSKEDHRYVDNFDYSWGQYIARLAGCTVYNFTRGGMSCKEYMQSFGASIDAFNDKKKCEAYIIALGVNDLLGGITPCGDINDESNEETMSRYYQEIIKKYKEIAPHAKFFFVTMANEPEDDEQTKAKRLAQRDLLYKLANKYTNSYVIDLYKYGPAYDKEFKDKFYLYGHMNAAGYKLTALMISSYIDYIIRSDFKSFAQVGFINTIHYDTRLD